MAFTKFTTDVNYHQALPNRPNANGGLTADQLKERYDQGVNDLKDFVNDVLTPELDSNSGLNLGIVNVMSYGAKNDDTTDSSPAINAALAAARISKSPVVIPGGTFKILSPIVLQKYDRLIGVASEKTILKAYTAGMVVLDLTVQEITVKDLFITCNDPIKQNYIGIKLGASSCVIDNVEIFYANKSIQVPSGGCYNNNITNLFIYSANYGLYCETGAIFNANRVNFRTMHGAGYDVNPYYSVGDIGIRLLGSVNTFTGGELAGFEYGVEVISGGENNFDLYGEKNLYGLKNTGGGVQDISKYHGCSLPAGTDSSLIRTENGLGVPGSTKGLPITGFNAMQDAIVYYLFDQFYGTGGKSIYDYSGNARHLVPNAGVTVADYHGVFGLAKSFIYPAAGDSTLLFNTMDGTKPITVVWSCKALSHPATSLTALKTVWINDSTGKYIRAIQLAGGGISVEVNDGSTVSFKFTASSGANGSDAFNVLGVDMTNNLIYKFNPAGGEYVTIACDFSAFAKSNLRLRLMYKDVSADDIQYAFHYLFAYNRVLNYGEIFEIAKTKTHYKPNQQVRRFYALATLSSALAVVTATETKIAHNVLTFNDGSFYDSTNKRFLIPAGIKKVRLVAQVEFASNATGVRGSRIFKNGAGITGYPINYVNATSGQTTVLQTVSPVIEVVAGDYFEHMVTQTSGGNLNANATNSWFSIEVVE